MESERQECQTQGETIRVSFCSPDAGFVQAVVGALGRDFEVLPCEELGSTQAHNSEKQADVVLVDLRPSAIEAGMDPTLCGFKPATLNGPLPPLVAILGVDEPGAMLRAMENGAYDVVTGALNIVELRLILRRACRFRQLEKEAHLLRSQLPCPGRLHELIGASESMQEVFDLASRIGPCDVTVVITGETGTGKELLARAIHRLSPRSARPFLAFSCANLPETLVEDELFGHEKGAFTGALALRRGRLEMADQGTLFLDEVGDLSLGLQPKLLRVLQERTFERLGSSISQTANIRLVCATHRDLAQMVAEGRFREDLYYRLNVVQIHLPPLRERRDDIPLLAEHFLARFAQQFGKNVRRFSRSALEAFEEYSWPGNVRQLENVVQRAVVLAEGSTIEIWHLPMMFRRGFEVTHLVTSYEEEVREFKRRLLLRALRQHHWRKTETARALGMARNYLHRLINQLQIRPEQEAVPKTERVLETQQSGPVM